MECAKRTTVRGAALLEAAVLIPLLYLILAGSFDLARYLEVYTAIDAMSYQVTRATQEATRIISDDGSISSELQSTIDLLIEGTISPSIKDAPKVTLSPIVLLPEDEKVQEIPGVKVSVSVAVDSLFLGALTISTSHTASVFRGDT